MRNLGMVYQYSYEEQWQPKDIPVVFRMYQLNLNGSKVRVTLQTGDYCLNIAYRDSSYRIDISAVNS